MEEIIDDNKKEEIDLAGLLNIYEKSLEFSDAVTILTEQKIYKNSHALFENVKTKFKDFEDEYSRGYNRSLKIKYLQIFLASLKIRDSLYNIQSSEEVSILIEEVEDFLDYIDECYPDMKEECVAFVEDLDKNGKEV